MSEEVNKSNEPEEVDLIRLFEYFKSGIKSIFKGFGRIIDAFLFLAFLIKKNWILVLSLTVLGGLYGKFGEQLFGKSNFKQYEMVVKTQYGINYEIYSALSQLRANNNSNSPFLGILKLSSKEKEAINGIKIEPIKKLKNEIEEYYLGAETQGIREEKTDSIYYLEYTMEDYIKTMKDEDYALQKIIISTKEPISSKKVQESFLNYFNNLEEVKIQRESNLKILTDLENRLQRELGIIDSVVLAHAKAVKNPTTTSNQILMNANAKNNVEADLLYRSGAITRNLFNTQRRKSEAQYAVFPVSQLKEVKLELSWLGEGIKKYTILGFLLSMLILLGLRLNKYINKFEKQNG